MYNVITPGTNMETKKNIKTSPQDLKGKRVPLQGDPYKKYFSRGLEAPIHH
jgi:hypothetical protein